MQNSNIGQHSRYTSYLIPIEDFGDASMRHAELAGDDARPDARGGHLHDLQPNVVG